MRLEFALGLRFLLGRRRERFLTLIALITTAGVAVGVAALVVVLAVMDGFDADLRHKIAGNISHVVVLDAFREGIPDYEHVCEVVERVPGVVASSPFLEEVVLLHSETATAPALLRGVAPERELATTQLGSYMRAGGFREGAGGSGPAAEEAGGRPPSPCAVLGAELARNLGVGVGDLVAAVAPSSGGLGMGLFPARMEMEVTGIFRSGLYEYDSRLAYVPLPAVQSFLGREGLVGAVAVRCRDVGDADEVAEGIRGALAEGFPGRHFVVKTWTQMHPELFSALALEKTVMFVILTLIVLVAAFNISSTLIMVVTEKTRDIGILKSIGAPPGFVMRVFVAFGVAIGAAGTFLGAAAGLLLCGLLARYRFIDLPPEIYGLNTLPVRVSLADVVATCAAALLLSLLATLYPAWRASRLDAVEALRYE